MFAPFSYLSNSETEFLASLKLSIADSSLDNPSTIISPSSKITQTSDSLGRPLDSKWNPRNNSCSPSTATTDIERSSTIFESPVPRLIILSNSLNCESSICPSKSKFLKSSVNPDGAFDLRSPWAKVVMNRETVSS